MSARLGIRFVGIRCCRMLRLGVYMLSVCLALAASVRAADPPPASKAAILSETDRKKLLAERDRLSEQALDLQAKRKYAQAITVAEKMLAIERQIFGEVSEDAASSWELIADCELVHGDLASARQARERVMSIKIKLHGLNDYRTIDARVALQDVDVRARLTGEQRRELMQSEETTVEADALDEKGEHPRAELLYRRVLDIQRKLLGETHPYFARSLIDLAINYLSQGQFPRAEPLLREAVAIRRKELGPLHPGTAVALDNLAYVYELMGDYSKAEPLYLEALDIRRKVLGDRHRKTATSLNDLAFMYWHSEKFAKAEPLFLQALEIDKQVFGDEHPATAAEMDNLGKLYCDMGDYAKAEPLLLKALAIRKKALGETTPDCGNSLNNLALLYCKLGDYAKAEGLYLRALEIDRKTLGEAHPLRAIGLINLADLYELMGNYTKAEPLRRQALETFQSLLDQAICGLGEREQLIVAAETGSRLQDFLSLAGPAHVSDADAYTYVLRNKASVMAGQSLIRLQRVRPELKSLFLDIQTINSRLANLSLAGKTSGRPGARLRDIAELTEQRESLESKLATASSEFAQMQKSARLSPLDQLQRLKAAIPEKTALVDVFRYRRQMPRLDNRRPVTESRMCAFIIRRDAEIHQVDLGPIGPIANLIATWRESFGEQGSSVAGAALRKLLWEPIEPFVRGADTIFLSPDGPLHRFPFAALPGSRPDQYLLEERNFIIAPVPRLLPQLLTGATDLSAGRQPSAPLLIGDVDFDSTGYPARMELAQSETVPLTGQHRSAIRGEKGLAQFPRLPGTAREIQSIGALYRESGAGEPLLISGSAATEEAFRREAPRHRWVHVATHGFFAPETVPSALGQSAGEAVRSPGMLFGSANEVRGYHPGLLSGIVFAGANALSSQPQSAMPGSGERDEGIMTALEVSGLDLSSVDLVVLSACETGLGKTAGGEGVLGLQRAFQIAGAKYVIASLWKVDDAATAVLMRLFYQKLWREKKAPSAALRESQLWILNHPDQIPTQTPARGANFDKVVELPGNGKQSESHKRSSPYLWAGFLISGAGQ